MKQSVTEKMIKDRNTQWESSSREEKRMLICRDVLDIIRTSRSISVVQGTYCDVEEDIWHIKPVDIQKGLLDTGGLGCTVCARGAMMISRFRFKGTKGSVLSNNSAQMTSRALQGVFSDGELRAIEKVFEREPNLSWEILDKFDLGNAEHRLEQIMERIIFWKGDVTKALRCGEPPKLKIPKK